MPDAESTPASVPSVSIAALALVAALTPSRCGSPRAQLVWAGLLDDSLYNSAETAG